MSDYQLSIDGSGAEQGAERIVKSFEAIKSASASMERGVVANANKMMSTWRKLNAVEGISTRATKAMDSMALSIRGIKGPSASVIRDIQSLGKAMDSLSRVQKPDLGKLPASLGATSRGLSLVANSAEKAEAALRKLEGLKNLTLDLRVGRGAEGIVNLYKAIRATADEAATGVRNSSKAIRDSYASLSGLKGVGTEAVGSILAMSKVMQGFRGPSKGAVDNTASLLNVLRNFQGVRVSGASGLAAFLGAMAGFRGPSANAGKNTSSLLTALQKAVSLNVGGAKINGFLASLANFRGPSPTAGRNTTRLLNALTSFSPPANMNGTVVKFKELADAIDRAANSMRRLRAQSGPLPNSAMRASSGVKNLTREHGFLQSAIFKTTTAWNALGGILAGKLIVGAANDMLRLQAQMEAATGSTVLANAEIAYLRQRTEELGLSMVETAKSYGLFLGSVKGTNVSISEARNIFDGFSVAGRALQLSVSDMDGVFRALGQIISKNKLQAEELRGQLGDRLPGAFIRMAVALGVVPPKLDDMMKKGQITGKVLEDALTKMANSLRIEFAESAEKASKTVDAAFNRMKNAFVEASSGLGSSGMNQALISISDTITKLLKSDSLSVFLEMVGRSFKFVGDNITFFASVLGGAGIAAAIGAGTQLLKLNVILNATSVAMSGKSIAVWARYLAMSATQVTGLSKALRILGAVMLRHPLFFAGAALAGVIYLIAKMRHKTEEMNSTLIEAGKANSDLAAAVDAYSARMDQNSGALDENTKKIRENIAAKAAQLQQEYATGSMGSATSVKKGQVSGVRQGRMVGMSPEGAPMYSYETTRYNATGRVFRDSKGAVIPKEFATEIAKLVRQDESGKIYGKNPGTQAELNAQAKAYVQLGTLIKKSEEMKPGSVQQGVKDIFNQVGGNLATIQSQESAKIPGTLSYRKAFNQAVGGEYGQGAPAPSDPEKAGKPDKAAASAAKQDAADLRRALNDIRDLGREVSNAYDTVAAIYTSAEAAIAADAKAAAVGRLDNIMDSYASESRGKAGIIQFGKELQDQAKGVLEQVQAAQREVDRANTGGAVDAEALQKSKNLLMQFSNDRRIALEDMATATVDTYEKARKAVEAYVTAEETAAEQGRTMVQLAKDIEASRRSRLRESGGGDGVQGADMVRATREGTRAVELATAQNEAYAATEKLAADQKGEVIKKLVEEKLATIELNREISRAAELRSLETQAAQAKFNTALYSSSLQKDELEYYKELNSYRQQQIDAGYTGSQVDDLVQRKRAVMDLVRTEQQAADQYEKIRQRSQDNADAIVDGFREAIVAGESFKKTMKNIFQSLKEIALDSLIFNPLRELLTNTFSGLQGGGAPGTTTSSGRSTPSGLQSILGAGQSIGQILGGSSPSGGASSIFDFVGGGVYGPDRGYGTPPISPGPSTSMDPNEIVVNASKFPHASLPEAQPISINSLIKPDLFSGLKKVFDFRANGQLFKDGLGNIGKVFSKTGSMTSKLSTFGKGLGQVAQVAGTAFAAFSVGKGLGKALGLGKVGSSAMGGAAAGFAVAGPIGGAVGAVLGGLGGLLSKKKTPSASVTISVDSNGVATAGQVSRYGKGDTAAAKALGAGGTSLFTNLAAEYEATLGAGNYGTFGKRKDKTFYSFTGNIRKGKPRGVEGTDYIYGTESELQAFATLKNIRAGNIKLGTDSLNTVAANTKATTMEQLTSDFNVAKSFDAFIKGSFKQSSLAGQIDQLNTSFKALSVQSKALGLSENKLADARARMLDTMRVDFNFDVNQAILEIQDPIMAAYNALAKEYKDTVSDAMAVGGDLAAVEKLYGLKRTELVKQYSQQQADTLRKTFSDLYNQLTATSSSPLSAQTVLNNSRNTYEGLRSQLQSGDFSNIDKLSGYTEEYLNAARAVYSSSADYFDVFNSVTQFLKDMSLNASAPTGTTDPADLPSLPSLDSLVAEITAYNQQITDATKSVGVAVVETGTETNSLLQRLLDQGITNQAVIQAALNSQTVLTQLNGGSLKTVAETTKLL